MRRSTSHKTPPTDISVGMLIVQSNFKEPPVPIEMLQLPLPTHAGATVIAGTVTVSPVVKLPATVAGAADTVGAGQETVTFPVVPGAIPFTVCTAVTVAPPVICVKAAPLSDCHKPSPAKQNAVAPETTAHDV